MSQADSQMLGHAVLIRPVIRQIPPNPPFSKGGECRTSTLSLIPNGWIEILTADTFNQVSTNTKKVKTKDCKTSGKFPVIDQGQSDIAGFVDDASKLMKVTKPLVIFGDHTRIIKWVVSDFVPGADGTKVLAAANFLEPKYFYYQLRSLELPDKGYARHFRYLNETSFKVAPLTEQQQIVAKLDELLAQVDNLKTRLDNIPKILKRFRQSVLAAAASGKLTEDWRKDNHINEWCFTQLSDLNIDIQIGPFGSLLHKSDYVEGGIPLVNPMHINDGKIIPSTFMTVTSVKAAELQRYNLQIGDIVLGRRGEMGRAAVVNMDGLICGTGSLYLRPNLSDFESIFIWLVLSASETIKYLEDNSVGTTMVNLNQKILKALPFPNIEKKEQTEIVARVEQLFAYADQIEQRVKDAQSRVNHLTQAILAKAFRGELTAEWRAQNPDLISGENSAEALLARIQEERETVVVTKKTVKKEKA